MTQNKESKLCLTSVLDFSDDVVVSDLLGDDGNEAVIDEQPLADSHHLNGGSQDNVYSYLNFTEVSATLVMFL